MKTMIALLLLTTTLAHAGPAPAQAQEKNLLCRMKEQKGHQTEQYSVRLHAAGGDAEFNLRLYPKVVAQLGTQHYEGPGQEILVTLLDYDMPDAETVGDMMVGDAVGYGSLDVSVKLDHQKDHEVQVSCSLEE